MRNFLPAKPKDLTLWHPYSESQFNNWYDKEIVPLFENVVEVYGHPDSLGSGWHYALKQQYADNLRRGSTHKALLINIKPIKKETAEDLLREFCSLPGGDSYPYKEIEILIRKSKTFLEEK